MSDLVSKRKGDLTRDYRAKNRRLAAGFENWLRARNYSPSTQNARIHAIAQWLAFLGPDDLTTITHSRIRLFMAQANKDSAQRRQLDALRAFYRFLLLAGVVHFSPARFIQLRKKPPQKLPRVLTELEIERLMRAASTPSERAILEIFYATGCRLAEIARLRVCDINFVRREIRILGKGNRERVALFGQYALKSLRLHLDGRKTGALFLGRHGKPACGRALYGIIKRVSRRAGLPHVHPHLLRHSFATHLLSRGTNLRYVQELLGHRSIQSTQIYTHVAMDDLRAIHERCHPHGRENTCDVKNKS